MQIVMFGVRNGAQLTTYDFTVIFREDDGVSTSIKSARMARNLVVYKLSTALELIIFASDIILFLRQTSNQSSHTKSRQQAAACAS